MRRANIARNEKKEEKWRKSFCPNVVGLSVFGGEAAAAADLQRASKEKQKQQKIYIVTKKT